mgnify:CR=1 FL=1
MPARNATQTVLDEAKAAKSEPLHLFELFLATPVYATDAPFQISWGGNTYSALGHFIAFSGGEENRDLTETRIAVSALVRSSLVESLVRCASSTDRKSTAPRW